MLRRLIAHQIIKDQHTNTASLHLRDAVLPTHSELATALLEQLRESFTRRNPITGRFKLIGAAQPRFQQLLIQYLTASDDATFIHFTLDAMEVLRSEMVRQQLATGGYVVFAEYDVDGASFLLTALLSTSAKPSFDDDLNLVARMTLDLDHLRHGARTSLEAVVENSDSVVQFISARRDGVSEYFIDFIGCEAIARPEVQGRLLFTALEAWSRDRNLDEEVKWQLMGRTYGHWQECRAQGHPMTLTALANSLSPDDPTPLLHHLGQEGYQLAGEFSPPPPQTMKRFVRFVFSGHGLKLEFDLNQWKNRISVNQVKRTLTIRDAPPDLIAAISEGT